MLWTQRKVDLGVDIGGTTGRVAALYRGKQIGYREFKMSGDSDRKILGTYSVDMANLLGAIYGLLNELDATVRSIGIGIAGNIAPDGRSLIGSGNLTWWVGQDVVGDILQAYPEARVTMGNDAHAAGLAEALFNKALGDRDFVFLIWGTGIGGCVIRRFGNKVKVYAGEPGHINIRPDGDEICPCGQRNCWERYAGGAGMCKHFQVESSKLLTADQWREVVDNMVIGCRALQTVQMVSTFVFGGGVASKEQKNRRILDQVETALREDLRIVSAPEVVLSCYGESAGTWGGYALAVYAGFTRQSQLRRRRLRLAA